VTLHPPSDWRPCSITEHLDRLRLLHDDLSDGRIWTAPPEKLDDYLDAAGQLLEHIDGKHQDDCRVRLTSHPSRPPLEPDIYERRAMGVRD
jgi:hypothetical protein